MLTDTYRLSNGVEIPVVGFGTWQTPDGDIAYNSVLEALRCGYRHIDTATAYGNEESVGKAINDFLKESPVKREELFVTTKLANPDHGYEAAKAAIDRSLRALNLNYVDLYLVHWPNPIKFRENWKAFNAESWKAMEEAYKEGKIRALGISNFLPHHYEALMESAEIAPVVNQIKLCPGVCQKELVSYSRKHNMLLEAYSPLGTGGMFKSPLMLSLSEKYGKSISQLCIRWSLQNGFLPLPKSVTASRIKENTNVFDFTISDEDMEKMAGINFEELGIMAPRDPDLTTF
ncbi:MAG: aldo/keto reductase [Sphaerochaetaceae bacterium]|nr:aldo/keto reductase [Sphaerochaetaceae bacterium]